MVATIPHIKGNTTSAINPSKINSIQKTLRCIHRPSHISARNRCLTIINGDVPPEQVEISSFPTPAGGLLRANGVAEWRNKANPPQHTKIARDSFRRKYSDFETVGSPPPWPFSCYFKCA
jgi:hypothetical protein